MERSLGSLGAAAGRLERLVEIRERQLGDDDPRVATALAELSAVQADRERWGASLEIERRVLAILEDAPDDETTRTRLAAGLDRLARAHEKLGDPVAALEARERQVRLTDELAGEAHDRALHALASFHERRGDPREAEDLHRRLVERDEGSSARRELGQFYRRQGRLDEAERLLIEVLDERRGEDKDGASIGRVLRNLAAVYETDGRPRRGGRGPGSSGLRRLLGGPGGSPVRRARVERARLARGLRQHPLRALGDAGETWTRPSTSSERSSTRISSSDRPTPRRSPPTGSSRACSRAAGHVAEAEDVYRTALRIAEHRLDRDDPRRAKARRKLRRFHRHQGGGS